MTEADLFIGAGGGTSWERAALGLPTICIAVSNNQQANGEVMAAAGAHVFLGAREQVSVEQLRQAIGFVVGNQRSAPESGASARGNWSMGVVRGAWP